MPVYLNLLNLDEIFHTSKTAPIIINELSSRTETDREYYNSLVKQTFTSDIISVMPKCQCGELKGEYRIGEMCTNCHTEVKQSIEDDINPTVWFRRPNNVEKLINPVIWIMLNQRFTKNRFRVLEWLIDRNYEAGHNPPKILQEIVEAGIPRGYNSFVQNFDSIINWLFDNQNFKNRKESEKYAIGIIDLPDGEDDALRYLLKINRDRIFSDYLPILNRSLLVLDIHATGRYLDESTIDIKDTLNTMLSIDRDYYNRSQTVIENRTAKILNMLCGYYENLLAKNISTKEGLIRQHGYGSRGNLSFRTVITSHQGRHDYDEIHPPWCIGLTTFAPMLMNKLLNERNPYGGMTYNEATEFLYKHVEKYHPLIDQLLREMISEFPKKYVPCLYQRNRYDGFLL